MINDNKKTYMLYSRRVTLMSGTYHLKTFSTPLHPLTRRYTALHSLTEEKNLNQTFTS